LPHPVDGGVKGRGTVALSANLSGTLGVRTSATVERGCRDESSSSHPTHPGTCLRILWIPVPIWSHPDRRAVVLALRIVLPGSGGTARRTWHRGRPRDPLPVGSAVHTLTHRRGPAMSPPGWYSLVCRRDLCEGFRDLAVRL